MPSTKRIELWVRHSAVGLPPTELFPHRCRSRPEVAGMVKPCAHRDPEGRRRSVGKAEELHAFRTLGPSGLVVGRVRRAAFQFARGCPRVSRAGSPPRGSGRGRGPNRACEFGHEAVGATGVPMLDWSSPGSADREVLGGVRDGSAPPSGRPTNRELHRRREAPMRPARSASHPGVRRSGARADDVAPTGQTDHPGPPPSRGRTPRPNTRPQYPWPPLRQESLAPPKPSMLDLLGTGRPGCR